MIIGRNDFCPCGSGKKYKKCCLRKESSSIPNYAFLMDRISDFTHIKPTAQIISKIISKYNRQDAFTAIFCLNLWRRNRSALAQGLCLNMALSICNSFGNQRILEYSDFSSFYSEFSQYVRITSYEDYIIDDYGEVFINHADNSYPVIIGTGYQQVYGALRYLQTLATNTNHNSELIAILDYQKTIIEATRETNIPNHNFEIVHELPSEDFWNSIRNLFSNSAFCTQYISVSEIMGYQLGPIEMRHFVKYEDTVLPLCNLSILIDYYKILLNTVTPKDKDLHIPQTIHSLIENTFNFSPNTPNRVLIAPRIIDRETGKCVISDGILFAGISKHRLLIAISDTINLRKYNQSMDILVKNNRLQLVEMHYRKECHGAYGINIDSDCELLTMVVQPFTDIASHASWLEAQTPEFRCTALDLLYMIGFSDDIKEIIDFIKYDQTEESQIISIGGKSNLFFSWKSANRHISSGAIEYDHISLDYNSGEDYTYIHFKDKLTEFPRNGKGLFIDPLNWTVEEGTLGYGRVYHKGCHGFGGEVKNLANNVSVFLAHNVDFFTVDDFAPNSHTALKTIDELNERLFSRYSGLVSRFEVLSCRTLQLLYMPWQYAKKKHSNTFMNNTEKSIVFCDEHLQNDSLIIRYSVDPEVLLSAIENAPNRIAENTYFKELLFPLSKYSPGIYKLLEEQLTADNSLKKTVGVFHIEQHYYFSDRAIDTKIPAVSFVRARKEIAQKCFASGVEFGEYRGKAATATIRKMQLSVVHIFEDYLAQYDQFDLHQRLLGYFSVQQNGIIVNIKRYAAFTDLDDDVQLEFEYNTRSIREKYRRNAETAKYIMESNLAISHLENASKCSSEDFAFLLALADWLVTLQDTADTCHYTDFDLSISVDREYKIDTILYDDARVRYDEMLLRKYSSKDYLIKNDSVDLEYFEKAIRAFYVDTSIELPLLLSLIEYMQLGIIEDGFAKEIYPNVFEIHKTLLAEKYNSILEEPVADLSVITQLIDFITLDPASLKTANGKHHDLLPVWEREKRDNRFSAKPIVMHGEKCIFSPVAMNLIYTSWKSGIAEWYLPYEIGMTNLLSVLKQWKKRYEDEMVQDISQLFQEAGFDLAIPEVDLACRFPKLGFPEGLGDYDVLAIHKASNEIWIIESKVLQKVGSIYEDQMQQKSFFYQHKDDEKFQRRINYIIDNKEKVLNAFGIDGTNYSVIPYMVTNKLFSSRYKKIEFPIITYYELQKLLGERI